MAAPSFHQLQLTYTYTRCLQQQPQTADVAPTNINHVLRAAMQRLCASFSLILMLVFLNQKFITGHVHPIHNSHWESFLVEFSLSSYRPEVLCGEVFACHKERQSRIAKSLAVFPFMSKWGQKTIWSLETKSLETDQDIPQNIPSPPFSPSLSLYFVLVFCVNKLVQL